MMLLIDVHDRLGGVALGDSAEVNLDAGGESELLRLWIIDDLGGVDQRKKRLNFRFCRDMADQMLT